MDELKTHLTAAVRVSVTDSHGGAQSVDLSPSVAGWGHSSPDLFVFGSHRNRLRLAPAQAYSISVSYTPGSVPVPAKKAYFEIEDCASY
jgi:hypothetical protein